MWQIFKSFCIKCTMPACILLLWHLGTAWHWWDTYIVPSPVKVWNSLKELASSGLLLHHVGTSVLRVAAGFSIAAALALPCGILLGLCHRAHAFFYSLLEFFRNVPPLALLPMLILWFGIGETSKLCIVVLATFFPIFLNTLDGISRPDTSLLETGQVFGFSQFAVFWHIRLPMAIPCIFTGLRIGLGYSWRSLIGAEMIAASAGLGYMILDGEEMARPDIIVAGILTIGLLGVFADFLLTAIKRRSTLLQGGNQP
jgi:sulfonate transport system permease protein